jgi:hypothetical protein
MFADECASPRVNKGDTNKLGIPCIAPSLTRGLGHLLSKMSEGRMQRGKAMLTLPFGLEIR